MAILGSKIKIKVKEGQSKKRLCKCWLVISSIFVLTVWSFYCYCGRAQPLPRLGSRVQVSFPAPNTMAGWQSGYAAACKAVDAGSIPASASTYAPGGEIGRRKGLKIPRIVVLTVVMSVMNGFNEQMRAGDRKLLYRWLCY